MLRNILIILSIVLLVIPNSVSAAGSKVEKSVYSMNGYTFKIETDNESYQNLEVINDETQEIEYLEVTKENDGSYSYKSTSADQILEINSKDEAAVITDLHSGESNTINLNKLIDDFGIDIDTSGSIQPYDIHDGWNYTHMTQGDRATQVAAGITAVTTVISVITGAGWLGSGGIAVVAIIVSMYITQVYYTVSHFAKKSGQDCFIKEVFAFYSNSDRTNYIGGDERIWKPSRCY